MSFTCYINCFTNIERSESYLNWMMRGRPKKLTDSEKRPNQANPIPSLTNNTLKPPFLQQHAAKLQHKLALLKEQISNKKRGWSAQRGGDEMVKFLTKIGLEEYVGVLIENGIDSFDVLKDAKQAELEEIGLAKGHALKIVVSIKKHQKLTNQPAQQLKQGKQETAQQGQQGKMKSKSTVESNGHVKGRMTFEDVQTDSIPLEQQKKSFCLYCYSRSQHQFCTSRCEQLYHEMFEKYEKNLQKAEQQFMGEERVEREQLQDKQEFLLNFDFLDKPNDLQLDEEELAHIKQLMRQ